MSENFDLFDAEGNHRNPVEDNSPRYDPNREMFIDDKQGGQDTQKTVPIKPISDLYDRDKGVDQDTKPTQALPQQPATVGFFHTSEHPASVKEPTDNKTINKFPDLHDDLDFSETKGD